MENRGYPSYQNLESRTKIVLLCCSGTNLLVGAVFASLPEKLADECCTLHRLTDIICWLAILSHSWDPNNEESGLEGRISMKAVETDLFAPKFRNEELTKLKDILGRHEAMVKSHWHPSLTASSRTALWVMQKTTSHSEVAQHLNKIINALLYIVSPLKSMWCKVGFFLRQTLLSQTLFSLLLIQEFQNIFHSQTIIEVFKCHETALNM